LLLGAAFTSSSGFDLIEKSTIEEEMSLTHATAECSAYQFSVDLFKVDKLLNNFVEGVKESYKSANWTKFINQFGSHFVY